MALTLAPGWAQRRPFPGSETELLARAPEPEAGTAPKLDPIQGKMLEVPGYLR